MSNLIRNHGTALKKTASYYVLHILVAAAVAWAVTGDLIASLTLSLLEPTVQAFAYFGHEKVWSKVGPRKFLTLMKSATYYVMHVSVAAGVAYAVTGDLIAAVSLSLLEPAVQMFVYYFHDKYWERKKAPPQTGLGAPTLP